MKEIVEKISRIEGDHISKALERGSFYEPDLLKAIQDLDLEGTYLDIGAHIGNHSVFFRTQCRAKTIIAFEPNKVAYDHLVVNADRFGFQAVPYAVHDVWRSVEIAPGPPNNIGMAKVIEASADSLTSVPSIPIDALNTPAIFMKIDVEGCEHAVIRSASLLLKECHPVLAIETLDLTGTEDLLSPYNYRALGRYCATPTYLWR